MSHNGEDEESKMSQQGVPVGDGWGGTDWQPVRPATKSGMAVSPIPPQPESGPESQPTPVRREETLQQRREEAFVRRTEAPKPKGWRAIARKLGLGVAAESPQETRERLLDELARANVRVTKNILVANSKGGSGKSTTALTLAAAFGVNTGLTAGLLDNNATGNLAERIEDTDTQVTLEHVVAQLRHLESPTTPLNEIQNYMRYQRTGRFHVLASRERAVRRVEDGTETGAVVWSEPTIGREDFHRVHQLLTKVFSALVIDSGNNEAEYAFRAALEVADQLIIPLEWLAESCDKAGRLLASLEEAGYKRLADQAIIIATHGPGVQADPERRANYMAMFTRWGNRVLDLPTDPALVLTRDQRFNWSALKPATQDAAVAIAVETTRSW